MPSEESPHVKPVRSQSAPSMVWHKDTMWLAQFLGNDDVVVVVVVVFFWMCISIDIWICLESMKWTWTWILEPLLQALWIGIIQMDPLQSWLVKMSSSSCFWLIKRYDLIVYFQWFLTFSLNIATFLVRFMVQWFCSNVEFLRADKPENPRRLNSCPQKRGTKSSTDLASCSGKTERNRGSFSPFLLCQYEGFFYMFRQFITLLT